MKPLIVGLALTALAACHDAKSATRYGPSTGIVPPHGVRLCACRAHAPRGGCLRWTCRRKHPPVPLSGE